MFFLDNPRYDNPSISVATLDDSRITLLISENAGIFLRYPATDSERTGRTEIVNSLREDQKFYADVISLKLSLVSLDSAVTARRMAATHAVKCFKNVKVLKSFVTCVDKICALEGGGGIIRQAQNQWGVSERDFIEEMKSDIKKAEEMIDSMGYVSMRLDNTGFSLIKDENNDNFVDKLLAISDELKIEPPRPSRLTLKLDNATAEALEKLFPEIFKFLGQLIGKYEDLPTKRD